MPVTPSSGVVLKDGDKSYNNDIIYDTDTNEHVSLIDTDQERSSFEPMLLDQNGPGGFMRDYAIDFLYSNDAEGVLFHFRVQGFIAIVYQ